MCGTLEERSPSQRGVQENLTTGKEGITVAGTASVIAASGMIMHVTSNLAMLVLFVNSNGEFSKECGASTKFKATIYIMFHQIQRNR